jgi:hypothetical protein
MVAVHHSPFGVDALGGPGEVAADRVEEQTATRDERDGLAVLAGLVDHVGRDGVGVHVPAADLRVVVAGRLKVAVDLPLPGRRLVPVGQLGQPLADVDTDVEPGSHVRCDGLVVVE